MFTEDMALSVVMTGSEPMHRRHKTVLFTTFDDLSKTQQKENGWAGIRDGRFGSKVGQIGPKWAKSGAFSNQISVHLAPGPGKRPRICPIWGESDPLWSQNYHPWMAVT